MSTNTDAERKLKDVKLFLLDMDGTIYLDSQLFDGTLDFLRCVKESGKRYMFMTNNSSRGVEQYIEKLDSMGIYSRQEDFFTSADAAQIFLQGRNYHKIYLFGTRSFRNQLLDAGLPVTDKREDDVDCLMMGFDTELTFGKLEDACILLGKDIDYIATNPDWVCPTWYGSVPDCGSVSEMLYRATGRRPKFLGKPNAYIASLAMEKAGYSVNETAVVGDRIYTDIACGVNSGALSIFLLGGEGVMSDIEKYDVHPDLIYDNIRALYNAISS